MSWKTVRVQDIAEVFDGPHATPPKSDDGPIYLGIPSILPNGGIDYENSKRISYADFPKWTKRVTPRKDDVVFSYEANLESYAIIPEGFEGCLGRRMALMRPDTSKVNPRFLFYYMNSPQWRGVIAERTVLGATVNRIPIATFPQFPIELPSLDTQERIASILMAYDNLIENNRRQIALLEEAAQRLYREWFVDLRFPGYDGIEFVNGLPASWQTTTIRETCKKIQSGGTPSRKKQNYWNPATVKWFKTGELRDCWLIEPEERISEEGLNGSAAKLFEPGTIVMAIYASPTLGRLGILDCEAAFNQAMLGLVVDESVVTREWLYWKLYVLRTEFNMIARGAGQQNISGEIVKSYEIVLPDYETIDSFTNAVGAMSRRRLVLQRQIIELTEARDRLLPKLMSGEIEVEG